MIASIKAIPFGIKKNNLQDIINICEDCFKILPFQKKNIHLIQTTNQNTRTKILEKTLEVTKDRLLSCGIKKIVENKCSHEIKSICTQLKKNIFKILLIFLKIVLKFYLFKKRIFTLFKQLIKIHVKKF